MKNPFAPIKKIFDSVICTLKLTANFQKCFGFYILDILKYLILFWPILFYSLVSRTSVLDNTQYIDYHTRWSDKTMNDCYLCKNKKTKRNNNNNNGIGKGMGEGFKNGKNGQGNGFFYFLSFCFFVILLFSALWVWLRPPLTPPPL